MLTLTIRHARGDDLYVLRRLLSDSYGRLKAGARGRELKRELRYVGDVRGAEQTHGANGWHPHLHALWFLGGAIRPERMRRLISVAWERAVRNTYRYQANVCARILDGEHEENPAYAGKRPVSRVLARKVFGARYMGGTLEAAALAYRAQLEKISPAPDEQHGVTVSACSEEGASYISKLGLEVGAVTKTAKSARSRTSWELANDAAGGQAAARALWSEHESAMLGAAQLTWSRGLRDALLPGEPERTDDEIAAEPPEEDERLIGTIDSQTWDANSRARGQEWLASLHDAHARGQLGQVLGVVLRTTPWDHRLPPPLEPRLQYWELWEARKRGREQLPPKPKFIGEGWARMSRAERELCREDCREQLAVVLGWL